MGSVADIVGRPATRSGTRAGALVIGLVVLVLSAGARPASAGEGDADAAVVTLAERYVPFVAVRDQEEPCDTEREGFAPATVDIVLDNPEIVLRGADGQIITTAPSAADLFGAGAQDYLDYPGDALDPRCVYEEDFRRFNDDRAPLVYARVAREPGRDGLLALQYWTYWYFNDWNNNHETDWEGVQLIFEADTAEEALARPPVEVGFAQHEGGERHAWSSDRLDRDGDRITLYASAGSHASYYGSDLYLGRSSGEGFGCDDTSAPIRRLDPDVTVLPDTIVRADDPLAWLAFDGRWGEKHPGPYNGPTGPVTKDRWSEPITWQEGLRDSSVTVPAGENFGPRATDAFCGLTTAGSLAVIELLDKPLITAILLVAMAALVVASVRVARPALHDARSRRRTDRRRYDAVGLIFVPVAIVVTALQGAVLAVPPFREVVDLAGDRGAVSIALALGLGLGGGLAAWVVVQAVVSLLVDADEAGDSLGVIDAYRGIARLWRSWASAVAWSAAVVVGLAVTVVGLPWAVRRSVRWAFAGQAVATRHVGGRAALRASAASVQGRWWSTAATLLVTAGLALAAGPVVGIALMLATGLPLAVLNTVSSLVYVLTVPVAALALDRWWRDEPPRRVEDAAQVGASTAT